MKFATWNVYFPQGSREGITPDTLIRERGSEAFGLTFLSDFQILGTFSDNADTSGLEHYAFNLTTKERAMSLILEKDAGATINENGEITFSPYVKQ